MAIDMTATTDAGDTIVTCSQSGGTAYSKGDAVQINYSNMGLVFLNATVMVVSARDISMTVKIDEDQPGHVDMTHAGDHYVVPDRYDQRHVVKRRTNSRYSFRPIRSAPEATVGVG